MIAATGVSLILLTKHVSSRLLDPAHQAGALVNSRDRPYSTNMVGERLQTVDYQNVVLLGKLSVHFGRDAGLCLTVKRPSGGEA
jgi:hypothetical protein